MSEDCAACDAVSEIRESAERSCKTCRYTCDCTKSALSNRKPCRVRCAECGAVWLPDWEPVPDDMWLTIQAQRVRAALVARRDALVAAREGNCCDLRRVREWPVLPPLEPKEMLHDAN